MSLDYRSLQGWGMEQGLFEKEVFFFIIIQPIIPVRLGLVISLTRIVT